MLNPDPSRREVILASLGFAAAPAAAPLTAGQVVDRIRTNIGIPWRTETVDKIVLGSADVPVKGIATTMMATLDVLERAAAAGKNLVITHETPVYLHQDQTADLAGDPTYEFKVKFVRDHDMAVFHFHDHWHARHPDGIATGMMKQLGWERNVDPQNPRRFEFPATSLEQLAKHMALRLQIRNLRVVGDPKLPVRRAFASWGFVSRMPGIAQFRDPDIDLYIGGETREWELVEYVQDTIAMGRKKALILLGHVVSEQAGMQYCAEWLRTFISELPVDLVAAPEPFWNPSHPVSA
jgi:putative NIF3 family GTP cyclohydrolase 1 type 2